MLQETSKEVLEVVALVVPQQRSKEASAVALEVVTTIQEGNEAGMEVVALVVAQQSLKEASAVEGVP